MNTLFYFLIIFILNNKTIARAQNDSLKEIPFIDNSYLVPTNLLPSYLNLFFQPFQEVPSNLDEKKVKFKLYTRYNELIPTIIELGDKLGLRNSYFDYQKPVIFYTHGYTIAPIFPLIPKIHMDILREKDVNVFLVDWTATSFKLENQMLANAPVVGRRFGAFIDWLKSNGPLDLSTLHLIGFSMGSHLSGIAARSMTSGKPMRITGMDPPEIIPEGYSERVRKGDAEYVEIYHTNTLSFAQKTPLGDADFYPNWGTTMPGCLTELCNHIRAFEFFEVSVGYENAFKAIKCLDYNEILQKKCTNQGTAFMGGLNFKNISGVYYLETTGISPYYIH